METKNKNVRDFSEYSLSLAWTLYRSLSLNSFQSNISPKGIKYAKEKKNEWQTAVTESIKTVKIYETLNESIDIDLISLTFIELNKRTK